VNEPRLAKTLETKYCSGMCIATCKVGEWSGD
jgi:hypothetical protein